MNCSRTRALSKNDLAPEKHEGQARDLNSKLMILAEYKRCQCHVLKIKTFQYLFNDIIVDGTMLCES